VFFCCFASGWPSAFVAPLLTTVSILMCGCGGAGGGDPSDLEGSSDAVAGFSYGMGIVSLTRGVASFRFSSRIGLVGVRCDVAVAGFSNGTGVVDVAGDVVSAAGCCAC